MSYSTSNARTGQRAPSKALVEAIKLLKGGFWPVAIMPGEKRPIGKDWGSKRWDEAHLRSVFEQHPEAGVGICFGPVRGPGDRWLIDLEGDGAQAGESLAKLFNGEVPDTPAWSSARGEHRLFVVDNGEELLRKLAEAGAREGGGVQSGVYHLPELPDLEIRVGGFKADGSVKQVQSVAPPTPGTDGKRRAWTCAQRGEWLRSPRRFMPSWNGWPRPVRSRDRKRDQDRSRGRNADPKRPVPTAGAPMPSLRSRRSAIPSRLRPREVGTTG